MTGADLTGCLQSLMEVQVDASEPQVMFMEKNLPWSILVRSNYHRFFISDTMLFGLPNDMLLWGVP